MTAVQSEMKAQPKTYPLEVLDQLLFLQEDNNDHQIRGIIRFDGLLDHARIERALSIAIEMIPVLGCRLVEGSKRAFWEKLPTEDRGQIVRSIETTNPEDEIERFLAHKANTANGPQLLACVILSDCAETLCIVVNHMAFDGTAFKEFLYLVSQIYSRLKTGENLSHVNAISADRSLWQVFRQFSRFKRLGVALLPQSAAGKEIVPPFPREREGHFHPMFLLHSLPPERVRSLRNYGKRNGLTVNDMVLAAYYRTLYQMINVPEGELLRIPCMVDLRRYLPEESSPLFCNLASMIRTACASASTFQETASRIGQIMCEKKKRYPGLDGLGLLLAIQKVLSYNKFKEFVQSRFAYPLISLSNLGVLDARRLAFDTLKIREATILTALKQTPYFQLTFSSFSDSLTFSVSLNGTEKDRDLVRKFYSVLDKELP